MLDSGPFLLGLMVGHVTCLVQYFDEERAGEGKKETGFKPITNTNVLVPLGYGSTKPNGSSSHTSLSTIEDTF